MNIGNIRPSAVPIWFTSLSILRTTLTAVAIVAFLGIVEPMIEDALYLAQLLSKKPPSQLVHPLPAGSRLYDSWHASRSNGRRHEGIDIFAARGTPVRTTTEGRILRRTQNRLGGKVVWLLGPGGHRHYYAHLDAYAHIATGERVAAGTVIGFVGNTGNAKGTAPHLHYGIYTATGPINPYPLLRRDYRPPLR